MCLCSALKPAPPRGILGINGPQSSTSSAKHLERIVVVVGRPNRFWPDMAASVAEVQNGRRRMEQLGGVSDHASDRSADGDSNRPNCRYALLTEARGCPVHESLRIDAPCDGDEPDLAQSPSTG